MLETPGAASARVRQHLRAPSFAYKKLWAVILQLAAYLAALCLRRITDTIRLYHLIATRVTHWTPTPLRRLAVRITAPVGHVGMRVVACTRRGRDALAAMARAENADSLDPRTAPLPAASDVTTTDLTPPRPAPPRVDGISPRTYAAAETLAPPEGRRSRSRSPSPGLRSRSPSPSTRRRALPTLLQRQVLQTRGGVPVEVLRTRLSSSALRPSRVIVVVPGNPGLPEFYSEFLLALRASTGAHCLALGHTGHSIGTARRKPLALDAQIDLKRQALEQLRKTWADDVEVVLVGHSIGAYIVLHLLDSVDWLHKSRGIMLFPTVHHIGTTPNGKLLYPIIYHLRESAAALVGLLGCLPIAFQRFLIGLYMKSEEATPTAVEGARQLFHSDVVRACLYLAETEFETLHDLDLPLCSRLQDRLVWYFGQRDGWVTKHHAGDIADACPRSEIFNCERGLSHGFVLHQNKAMAEVMTPWLWQK